MRVHDTDGEETQPKIDIPRHANILIVDDQRLDRACLRRICNNLDFSVTICEAETLKDMSAALRHNKFDLVFLDFHMPDGNGLQAMKIIQFDPKNRYAGMVMVTGDSDTDVVINSMRNGCRDFISKDDISLESVRRATINALQKASLHKNLLAENAIRADIESVLEAFTTQCAQEFNPLLYNMLRHIRHLSAVKKDDEAFDKTIECIENTCGRLFDFIDDIDHHDRKVKALQNAKVVPLTHRYRKKTGPTRPSFLHPRPSDPYN
ncbi:response regulator receiver domain-containing protein [Pacificibacter maritimus]|uniref:Response regulator receiver domain-containing protein n=1 Tax=Pacificibacter maritimus TaxID=762213 RepID=A0A3N4URE6_9RHOB|nr:response regulator [Pacificibacter maritimus]RPE71235.1 response regulator receiver domain-containing protein [Pacificibacter maritimus]